MQLTRMCTHFIMQNACLSSILHNSQWVGHLVRSTPGATRSRLGCSLHRVASAVVLGFATEITGIMQNACLSSILHNSQWVGHLVRSTPNVDFGLSAWLVAEVGDFGRQLGTYWHFASEIQDVQDPD
jgi:hypothetical protein